MNKNNIFSILITAAIMTVFLLATGCSEEQGSSPDGGMTTVVNFSLSVPKANTSTRADGDVATIEENEKILNWFILFVDNSNEIKKIVKSSGGNPPVEEDYFKCTLPPGEYSVYAFANISIDDLYANTTLTNGNQAFAAGALAEGNTLTYATMKDLVWSSDLNLLASTVNIPMSGYKAITVRNTIEETFSIEVVRMVAKIELNFTNLAGREVTINSVSLNPVTTSNISLFPKSADGEINFNYATLLNTPYSPLSDALSGQLTYPKPAASDAETPTATPLLTLAAGGSDNTHFYIQESISTFDNEGSFILTLNLTHTGGATDYEQHNITQTVRHYINRNDRIVIPINISQYDVQAEAIFYPPIGGYPAYRADTHLDGSQIFTFGTQGEFSIIPKITDKATGEPLSPAYCKIELGTIKYTPKPTSAESTDYSKIDWTKATDVSETAKGIFTKIPTVLVTPAPNPETDGDWLYLENEIYGELSSSEGIARVPLTIHIYNSPYTDTQTPIKTISRTIYIIRDNSVKTSESD